MDQLSSHLLFCSLGAILMAAMVAFGNRAYRKGYLARWSVTLLMVGLFDAAAYFLSGRAPQATTPVVMALVLGIGMGAICWGILSGGFEMALRRPMALRFSRRILVVGAFGGLLVSFLIVLGGSSLWQSYAAAGRLATGIPAALAALLFVWERRRRLAPGFVVCFAALLLFGGSSILDGLRFGFGYGGSWISPLALFSIVIAGCSILLFAVEDDRQAALLAATQIEHIAYYDPLTGLPNRSLFLDRLIVLTSRADTGENAAVLFIDIDRLKEINDSLGHATGDAVIRATAKRIRDSVRTSDTAARFAGDEFVVLLANLQNQSDATRIASKLLTALEHPIVCGAREVQVSATIGISLFPDHGVSADELIRSADAAMYHAKKAGRNRYELYAPGAHAPERPNVDLEEALRRAIENKDLSVRYQPIVRLADGAICGVEALVRWQDDLLGPIPPSEFIPIAESSRLIGPLGELVLHQACRDVTTLFSSPAERAIFVSINLSPEQFVDPELIPRIRRALSTSRVKPEFLQFEVAEAAVISDPGRSVRIFERLREIGVKVAIDGFGPGYSSLSSLALFPIESLKIDRSLMTEDDSSRRAAVFSTAVAVGRRLGFTVVAEGIETPEHRDVALREGCDLGQGYLFGEPWEADTIRDLLAPRREHLPEAPREKRALDADITLVSRKTGGTGPRTPRRAVAIVADDDSRMRSLIATLLRRIGHQVLFAEDGRKTIDLIGSLDEDQIELIVLDLMMPRMSGWEVLDQITTKMPEIQSRILLITAVGTEEIGKINPRSYGAVLEKPFDQADFYDCVHRCSRHRVRSGGDLDAAEGSWIVH